MIQVKGLTIHQGSFSLTNIDFEIPQGEYGVLMGPSGSGKTTLVECICGLRRFSSGRILLGSTDVSKMAIADREIGYVPQDMALFPTMVARDQIAFALKARKAKKPEIENRIAELADLIGIKDLLGQLPHQLSGGQQQRVALARALSFRPRLLCLDEPLSSLDQDASNQLIECLRAIHAVEKTTVLHITHLATEASQLGSVQLRLQDGVVTSA